MKTQPRNEPRKGTDVLQCERMDTWCRALGALVLLTALCACSGTVSHPPYSPQPQSALVEVLSPPPPGRIEIVPASPKRLAVWIDGEWLWRRRKWAWSPGRWVDAPQGATYSPPAFVRGADGRLWMAPGVWRDDKGAVLAAPPPLAAARVESTEVIDAAGETVVTGVTLPAVTPPRRAAPPPVSEQRP